MSKYLDSFIIKNIVSFISVTKYLYMYYAIQISGEDLPGDGQADLCLHAYGGSISGAKIQLHGGVNYNMGKSNGTFFIKPVYLNFI